MDQLQHDQKRIHIIGSGSIGCFVAHAIRGLKDPPPVTLLLHRRILMERLESANRSITVTTDDVPDIRGGFDAELVKATRKSAPTDPQTILSDTEPAPTDPEGIVQEHQLDLEEEEVASDAGIIYNLIVTVKTVATTTALAAIKHRLSSESTIMFLQNGMGVVDEINESVFPDPEHRPNYVQGVITHGVHIDEPFSVIHAGQGTISLGLIPRIPFDQVRSSGNRSSSEADAAAWGRQAEYMLQILTSCPVLAAVAVAPTELLQTQLEKLAVNCIVNPLTVLLDCRNNQILNNFALSRTIYLLLAEICLVIQSLPELKGIPNIDVRFSPQRIESFVVYVAEKTGENISSMLQDSRRGNKTEIEYMNGYIVRRGEELGIRAVLNFMILQMVLGKRQLIRTEIDGLIPVPKGHLNMANAEAVIPTSDGSSAE